MKDRICDAFFFGTISVLFVTLIGLIYTLGFTGPCAFKGGISYSAPDYTVCGNGDRVLYDTEKIR